MAKPFIVVNSRMVELFDDDELRHVLGHELGHLLSGHAVYRTMMIILTELATNLAWLPVGLGRAARRHRGAVSSGGARPNSPPTGPACSPGRIPPPRCART